MLRAQQNKLAQDVNTELVDIRGVEIDYFVQFFTAFGTQCALIAGSQFVALAEIRTEDSDNVVIFSYIFWIFNALTIGLSLHVLLCSVYIAVYGQGLALRGPIGSMVRAVEGMVVEQQQVVYTFTFCILSLSIGTMGAFFVQMKWQSATVACIVLACCMLGWYHYCLRIYNRFKFTNMHKVAFNSRGSSTDGLPPGVVSDYHRGVMQHREQLQQHQQRSYAGNPMNGGGSTMDGYGRESDAHGTTSSYVVGTSAMRESLLGSVSGAGGVNEKRSEVGMITPRASFTESLKSGFGAIKGSTAGGGGGGASSGANDDSSGDDDGASHAGSEVGHYGHGARRGGGGKLHNKYSSTAPDQLVRNRSNIFYEGYITMRKGGQVASTVGAVSSNNNSHTSHFTKGFFGSLGSSSGQWNRVYLVLCHTAAKEVLLVYYNAKSDYERNPGKPVKQRPIDVSDYALHTTSSSAPSSTAPGGSKTITYEFSLLPTTDTERLKTCDFRCDTADELAGWVEVVSKLLGRGSGTGSGSAAHVNKK